MQTLSIKTIKDVFYFANEKLYVNDPNKNIKIEINQRIGVNSENNLINLTIIVELHYANESDILAKIEVDNVFHLTNLKDVFDPYSKDFLPVKIIVTMVGLSISHARAFFSKNLSGTIFNSVILPITDPLDAAKHFFPHLSYDKEDSFSIWL